MVKKQVKNPCIWMQAGVVARKECFRGYECQGCVFDQALLKAALRNKQLQGQGKSPSGKAGRIVCWQDRFMSFDPIQRPCVYHLKKKIGYRACFDNYECARCEFNQFFEDIYTTYTSLDPVDLLDVGGVRFPQGYYLHPGHLWVKVEQGSTVLIGLDDLVWKVFYPLELKPPLLGKRIRQHTPDMQLVRGPRQGSALSPVSGVVLEVNPRVWQEPRTLAADPYFDGWIIKVQAENLVSELKALMLGEQSSDFLAAEVDVLFGELEAAGFPLAADGGGLGQDIYGQIGGLSWQRLEEIFLHRKREAL